MGKYLDILEGMKNTKIDEISMSSKVEDIADEIEDMDISVSDRDRKKFDRVLDKYLDKVDPDNELTIRDAVVKLGKGKAWRLFNDLLDFSYEE